MSSSSDSESRDSKDGTHFRKYNPKTQVYRDSSQTDKRASSRSPKLERKRCKYQSERFSTVKGDGTHFVQSNDNLSKDLCTQNAEVELSDKYGSAYLSSTSKSISCDVSFPATLTKCAVTNKVVVDNGEKQNCYGPTLPPAFVESAQEIVHASNIAVGPEIHASSNNDTLRNLESGSIGSNSSNFKVYGPTLPPSLPSKMCSDEIKANVTCNRVVLGPQLPPDFKNTIVVSNEEISPLLVEDVHLLEDDESYGPLPLDTATRSKAHIALEERALQMKIDNLHQNRNHQAIREEWMIELPEVHSRNLGLGPRQFRANAAPDFSDRSSWTDTPQDKTKKKQGTHDKKIDLKKEAERKEKQEYDREQEKMVKKHKKSKKEKSLLETHQANLEKQKKEDPGTRRPFSRDIDLKVNHFDESQKKAILKKAQLLNDRFSSGQSKFL